MANYYISTRMERSNATHYGGMADKIEDLAGRSELIYLLTEKTMSTFIGD